jgi:hypothetical protein
MQINHLTDGKLPPLHNFLMELLRSGMGSKVSSWDCNTSGESCKRILHTQHILLIHIPSMQTLHAMKMNTYHLYGNSNKPDLLLIV